MVSLNPKFLNWPVTSSLTMFTCGLLLASCAPQQAPIEPAADGDATAEPEPSLPADSPSADPSARGSSASDARLRTLLSELDALYDVRNLALATEQHPPLGFVGLVRSGDVDFPPKSVNRAVGYVVGAAVAWKMSPDSAVPGCSGAIADDGTLCPEVVLPGRELDASQLRRLSEITRHRNEGPVGSCRDSGWPVHAWVFYDGQVPVAQVVVNLPCAHWSLEPDRVPAPQVDEFVRLCNELGLPGCYSGADEAERQLHLSAESTWWQQNREPGLLPALARPNPLRARPTGLPQSRSMNSLSAAEKRLLCQWNLQYSVWYLHTGESYGILDGDRQRRVSVFTWEQCVQRFPTCDTQLGEILPCMRWAQRGDPWFRAAEAEYCQARAACLWGYRTSDAP